MGRKGLSCNYGSLPTLWPFLPIELDGAFSGLLGQPGTLAQCRPGRGCQCDRGSKPHERDWNCFLCLTAEMGKLR